MKKLSNFFYQKSSFAFTLIVTAVMIAYFAFIFMDAGKCFEVEGGKLALGLSFGLQFDVVQTFFDARTTDMIGCYINFNTIWDTVFALLYGFTYVTWISIIYKPISNKVKLLNLLPLTQTLFDWGENFSLVNIANSVLENEAISSGAVQVASVFSMAKWSVSGLVFLAIGIGVVYRITRVAKGDKSK